MLIIPYKDNRGRIQACQLRLHKGDISEGEKRYRWLASPLERRGCSSGTPIHFTFKTSTLAKGKSIVITEGLCLKNRLSVCFMRQTLFLAQKSIPGN